MGRSFIRWFPTDCASRRDGHLWRQVDETDSSCFSVRSNPIRGIAGLCRRLTSSSSSAYCAIGYARAVRRWQEEASVAANAHLHESNKIGCHYRPLVKANISKSSKRTWKICTDERAALLTGRWDLAVTIAVRMLGNMTLDESIFILRKSNRWA